MTLSGAKWFSTLDMKSGCWQVELEPQHQAKTAFTIGYGFGRCNSLAMLQRLAELILRGLLLVYPLPGRHYCGRLNI